MMQSINPPELMALDDQVKVSAETSDQSTLMVTYNTGDDKIDPFLLSALNNPRDRLLLLKLDHELERFVNDSTKQRLEFPPMSSYQRLIVHRVAQYFLLDHAAVDVDNLKRAVVLFKSPQSRVPVLRLTDLREEPDAPPQKAVKIMRRTNNNSRNATVATGPGGERAPTDKTLEERETEYAKARARIFNESPTAAANATNANVSNTNNTTNNNTTTNIDDVGTDADNNETNTDENSNKTDTKKDDVAGDDVTSAKRATTGGAKGTRRPFTTSLSNPSLISSDPLPSHPLYSSDNLTATHPLYSPAPDSRSSLFSAPSSKALDMGDSGFSITRDLDGKNRIPLQQYQIGQFGSDGLFTGPIDTYLPRFDVGYEFADYPSAQEMAAWGMPHAQNLHPSFYGFPSPAGGADVGGFSRDDHAGAYGEAGKGGSSFYFDFAPSSTKEWSPQSSGTLTLNSPLSANAAPFEPSSHLHTANSAPTTPSSSSSPSPSPSTGPSPGPSTGPNGPASPVGTPSVINTNNTINTFNTINTYNTINTINTINIINTPQNPSPPSPPPAGAKTESPSPTPTTPTASSTPTPPSGSNPSSGTPRLTKAGSGSGPSFAAGAGTGSASSAGGAKIPGKTSPIPSPISPAGPPKSVSPPNTPAAPTTPTSSTTPSGGRPAQKPGSRPLHPIPSPPTPPNHPHYSQYHHRNSLSPPKYNATSSSATPTNVYGALRTTSPPPPQPPPTAQQLPPPAQIPMPPPSLYRPFPPNPAATYGFDGNSWNPYVFPTANSQFSALSHPLSPSHPLVQPHPLTHPHLYPPHPQFLPSQQTTFGNAALYPFLGPAPVQKPVASLDYERRPPKSTELFDPKAPQPPKRQNATSQIESGMRNMSIYPPNTSPHTSPLQPHPSQLTTQQGVKKGPPLPGGGKPQQIPPQKPPSLSSSHPPLQKPPPQQPNNAAQNQNQNPNPQIPPQKPPQAMTIKQPQLMTSSGPVGPAPRLLYDYPQQQGVYVPPDHTPPPAVAHILEIYDLPQGTPAIGTENPIFAVLKRAGASIKVLDSSVFIAIFKNAAAARKALENWESERMKGEECGYSLRQWAPAFLSAAPPPPVIENEGGVPS